MTDECPRGAVESTASRAYDAPGTETATASHGSHATKPSRMETEPMVGVEGGEGVRNYTLASRPPLPQQALDLRKVHSMGNLHTSRRPGPDGRSSLARIGEVCQDVEHEEDGAYLHPVEEEGSYNSDSTVPATSSARERKKGVPWTEDEHRLFLLGLQKLGKGDWRGISRHYVQTRTPTQVASHAQKYFIRQSNLNKRKRRSSLFDITRTDSAGALPVKEEDTSAPRPIHVPVATAVSTSSVIAHPHVPIPVSLQMPTHPFAMPPFPPPAFAHAGSSPPMAPPGSQGLMGMMGGSPPGVPSTLMHAEATAAHLPPFHPHMSFPFPTLPLPWSYAAFGAGAYGAPLTHLPTVEPPRPTPNNPKLCRPTPSIATSTSWPFKFPFPGMSEKKAEEAEDAKERSGSDQFKPANKPTLINGSFRCVAITGQG